MISPIECLMQTMVLDAVYNDAYHHFFFFCPRFSNHDGKCYKGMVCDTFTAIFIIENTVLVKEIKEYGSCNTFVSVTEAVVLGDKIKEIGCFFFKGRVNIFTSKTLVDIADAAFERIVLFMSEQVGNCAKAHLTYQITAFFIA